jgi:two-component system, cell cycle sensor histidine kinase and response regulator CckA
MTGFSKTRAEDFFRVVSDSITEISIVLLDVDGMVLTWPAGAEKVEGYRAADAVGQHFSMFFTPHDIDAGEPRALLDTAAARGHIDTETWHVAPDGRKYWAGIDITPVRDEDGEVTGFVRLVRDLTERRKAFNILRESEARYRHLVERATDMIYTHDLEGRIVSINEAAERLFCISRQECIGRMISDIIAPEHRERARAMTAHKLQHGGATTYRVDAITPAGRRVPLEISTQLIYTDGKPVAVQGIARDITERQEADLALARSERYFRALIENAVDAITIVNADASVRYSSPAIEHIIGYTPEERRGQSLFNIVHPDDAPLATEMFERVRNEANAAIESTLRARHRDGSYRTIRFRVRNLLADPAVAGIVINWHDITEMVAANELRRMREHFFRSIIERSSDILIVQDESRTVRYISPAFETLLGYKNEDLLGRTGMDLIHPDDHAAAQEVNAEMYERNAPSASATLRVRSASGEYRTFDVRARNLLDDPVFTGTIVDARDITDEKRIEEALRASEERFRKIVETAGEGIVIRDPEGHVVFANERFADMLGYKLKEIMGRNVFEMVAPDRIPAMMESAERRRLTGQSEHLDTELYRKDRTRVSVILSVNPLFDARGEYIGALGMVTDITERKRLEEQLRQSQKIEAVGRLAGGVAHDFNNLLTAIRGHVELLLAEVSTGASIRPDIEEIQKAADRAAALTQQLLAFSRRQVLQPRVIDIDQVVIGVETLLRRLIGEDIHLVVALESRGARVRADPGQLEQVLMNLAVNARDAMPKGGSLVIDTSVTELDPDFIRNNEGSHEGNYVRLRVTDSGVGMDQETLSHVFEPFYTTKEVGKGTGLGLATVYGIVKQSGGYIRVESRRQSGTTFEILLPEVLEDIQPARNGAPNMADARGETVLIAEDEDAVRALTTRILRKRGYHVLEAKHGVEALDIARTHEGRIDLLLTDVVMPMLGGRELGEMLMRARPDVKVLFMSGYTGDALLQRGLLEGSKFLEKPFTPNSLAAKVREVLESD